MTRQMQRRFTDGEVREIIDHHQRMTIAEIARLFQVHPSTIHNILTGKTYRNVTHDDAEGPRCTCPACRTSRQADLTVQLIHETVVTVPCFYCERPVQVTVRHGLDAHGEVPCNGCVGGRKQ